MRAQFNWIFILVAGAILLIFFVSFAFKYKALQEEKLNIEILVNLDRSLTNLQSSPFTTIDEIKLPVELEVSCNNLAVNDKKYVNNNFLFSPNKLKNNMLILYKQFNMPFKITEFYYLISPDKKFFLIYTPGNSLAEQYIDNLIKDLPEKFKANVVKSTNPGNGKNIYFYNANVNATKIIVMQNKVNIITSLNIYEDVNKELVYAAIFSDNFDCNYNKLNKKANDITKLYYEKAVLLQNSRCSYVAMANELNNFKLTQTKSTSIETINEGLSFNDCPVVY